jgi:hypothetical protein
MRYAPTGRRFKCHSTFPIGHTRKTLPVVKVKWLQALHACGRGQKIACTSGVPLKLQGECHGDGDNCSYRAMETTCGTSSRAARQMPRTSGPGRRLTSLNLHFLSSQIWHELSQQDQNLLSGTWPWQPCWALDRDRERGSVGLVTCMTRRSTECVVADFPPAEKLICRTGLSDWQRLRHACLRAAIELSFIAARHWLYTSMS